jgi:hypothetical protein
MANEDSLQEPQHSIQQILEAETNDFVELARIAGLDIATDFAGADLSGVDLSGADLRGANLSETDLSGADFSFANLSEANFSRAHLHESNLIGADLSGADLQEANLIGANLSEADFTSTVVDSTIFGDNRGLTEEDKADLRARGAIFRNSPDSNVLPQGTFLGNLEIFEIYGYYDKPCLFSCRNRAEHTFLAISVDETSDFDRWLYAPISLGRLDYLKSGGIDLRSAFSKAENGFVFDVEIFYDDRFSNIKTLACLDLTDDLLPVEGEFLNYDDSTITPKKAEASRTAAHINREVLDLTFNFPPLYGTEAPIANLGIILQSLQNLIDAIGQIKTGHEGQLGRIPFRITEETKLAMAGTFSGSFGVEIIALSPENLFGQSLVREAIEEFIALLKAGSKIEQLRERLLGLRGRSISRYRRLLKGLVAAGTGVGIEWGSPRDGRGGVAHLPLTTAKAVIDILDQITTENPVEYEITGELIGGNKRTASYEIKDSRKSETYSGKVLEQALQAIAEATIGEIYVAIIREKVEVFPNTGFEKIEYELVSLKPFT